MGLTTILAKKWPSACLLFSIMVGVMLYKYIMEFTSLGQSETRLVSITQDSFINQRKIECKKKECVDGSTVTYEQTDETERSHAVKATYVAVSHTGVHTNDVQTQYVSMMQKEKNNDIDDSEADKWKSMTISGRESFQQAAVEKFCENNYLTDIEDIERYLLTNNKTETLFCFAPKVGCTNLKILFFLTQDAIPSYELFKSRDSVNQSYLEAAISKLSLAAVDNNTKINIVRMYYKFVMYRNPIERLVSAYRSKIQRYPLMGLMTHNPHYNWLRMRIYRYKHPKLFHQWTANKGVEKIYISFSDFIDYWLHRKLDDEHFQAIYDLCQPCQIRYNFYGNFNNFNHDAEVLIDRMNSSSIFLRNGYYAEGELTSDLAPVYYRLLSAKQKELIITKLALDLSFYYSIFPVERDSHKRIMLTDLDVPVV